jgi:predicted dehydrogenase
MLVRFASWRLSVGYQRRTFATSRFLRKACAEHLFGPVRAIRIAEGARTTRAGDYGGFQDASAAQGGGLTRNLGCHSLDLALWIVGATSYSILDRRIAWDGDTDRRASARIQLTGVSGGADVECPFDWTVSWLDHQSNTVELEFDGCKLTAPIAPGPKIALRARDSSQLGTIDVTPTGGATSPDQAFYFEWRDILDGARARAISSLSAESCLLTANLMDDLLAR